MSFAVDCETQHQVDGFREKLSEGGEKQQCRWLRIKYGLSGEIAPTGVGDPFVTAVSENFTVATGINR